MSEQQLLIRTSGPDDLKSLLPLYRQLNPQDPTLSVEDAMPSFEQFHRYPGSAIFIGFVEENAVATCALVVVPNLTRAGQPYALIENVVTDAAYRKRGYGKAILLAAIDAAWEHDCYKVMLLTGSSNPATLKFYEGVGFEQNKTGFQVRRIPVRPES